MEVLKPPWKLNHFIMHISCNHIWQWIGQIIRYHDIPKESHFWIGSHYALLAKANNSLPLEKIIKIRSFSQKCNEVPLKKADFQRESKVEVQDIFDGFQTTVFWINTVSWTYTSVALKVSYFLICHCTCVATSRREQKRATSVWRRI